MGGVLGHTALLLAAAALTAAGWRVASAAVEAGLVRWVAAAVIAAALVVVEALLLGTVSLARPVPEVALALVTYAAARARLPAPATTAAAELGARWRAADAAPRACVGALALLAVGLMAWNLHHPYVANDGELYHLPLAGSYVADHRPGEIVPLLQGIAVSNYPVTNEVLLSWGVGISGGWTVVELWTVVVLAIGLAGAWVGLRALGVPRAVAAAGPVAFAAQPLVATQLGAPLTDVPAVSWLLATAGLCAVVATRRAPASLLGVALVAAGLSFGTKTTGALVLACVLATAAWRRRAELRAARGALALGALGGYLAGGLWVTRNLVDHGAPLWPLASSPIGDPVPPGLAPFRASLLSHPVTVLSGRLDDYADLLAGGLLLFAGAFAGPLLERRSRLARAALALTVVATLAWAAAPYTGIDQTALAVGAARYLLPALAVAATATMLGGVARPRPVAALLWLSALVSLARTAQLGFPYLPSLATLAAFALVGALAGVALRRPPPRWIAVAAAAVVLLAVSAAQQGFTRRHLDAGLFDSGLLGFAQRSADWRTGDFTVYSTPGTVGLLRGDRLRHRAQLIAGGAACRQVRAFAGAGWVVVQSSPPTATATRLRRCLEGLPPAYDGPQYAVFTTRRG